ncbi:hypothetical protein AMTRI_Chr04g185210 [Amborella trichopoda]
MISHPWVTISLPTSHPPTHLGFKPRHFRVAYFWERSTTHQTRLHRSAQENRFSLFLFFPL